MHKTTSSRHRLQQSFGERPVKSRRVTRITRPFIPLPIGYLETIPEDLRSAFIAIWEYGKGKPCEMPHRLLAKRIGRSKPTAERRIYALRDGGWLGVQNQKISCRRNRPNLYSFPHLDGFISSKEVISRDEEKPVQSLNANTTAPREAIQPVKSDPSPTQLQWEHRRLANHPPAMRRLYDENGALLAQVRLLRQRHNWVSEREKERNLGVSPWKSEVVATPEQDRELQERVKANEREGRKKFSSMTASWRHR